MKYAMSPPPGASGTEMQQLAKMRSWLYQMNEQLNIALSNLDAGNFAQGTAQAIQEVAENKWDGKLSSQYETLKALIIKTADTVESQIEAVEMELNSSYIAKSEWGTYEEILKAEMEATAQGVVQAYGYDAQLSAANDQIADFEDYKINTQQYIKTGLLYYEDSVPRYGVAVGEKLTTVEVDGETLLARTDLCATFTADKLSFWQHGQEVAYVSNSKLYITALEILGSITLGNWRITHTDGFTIEWIG